MGIDQAKLRAELESAVAANPRVQGDQPVDPAPSPSLTKALDAAIRISQQWGDDYIATEAMLLALARVTGVKDLLARVGADERRIRDAVDQVREGEQVRDESPEAKPGGAVRADVEGDGIRVTAE